MIRKFLVLSIVFSVINAQAQYNRQDSLRGSITEERAWWDLSFYHLDIHVDVEKRTISGTNEIRYTVLEENQVMQVDLQPPMKIDFVTSKDEKLNFIQEGNAYFIYLKDSQQIGAKNSLLVHFYGQPKESRKPPWEGGITWTKDITGKAFIASTCQGEGASLWWPCKDHPYDEVDSMMISVRVPKGLTNISNGRLRNIAVHEDFSQTFHWFVNNPINNYGVNINIGQYAHFNESYPGLEGSLTCDYYVLPHNLAKAKKQFKQVHLMLEAFEYWFGPYPFYDDGYKLVEVPYSGMEHQSSVTYGNGFENGYGGRDLSASGTGLLFDFIIIHESGHEWFANNITASDNADFWIHEGFTAYSENLYLDYHYGFDTASMYVLGTRSLIQNDRPLIGPYGVNYSSGNDIYYKGANILHTLRRIINDDDQWRQILTGLNRHFRHQTVSSKQIENFIDQRVSYDLQAFFNQYLRESRIPILEYRKFPGGITYRWANTRPEFEMPIDVYINGHRHRLNAKTSWLQFKTEESPKTVSIDPHFYVASLDLTGL